MNYRAVAAIRMHKGNCEMIARNGLEPLKILLKSMILCQMMIEKISCECGSQVSKTLNSVQTFADIDCKIFNVSLRLFARSD